MAWNKYYIFVRSPQITDLAEILTRLNLSHYKPAGNVPLHLSNKPDTLFAGFYNGNLLIVHPELPFKFFLDTQDEVEKRFIETFPDCEIAALIENSSVSLFSFAIIENGKKIRMKDGSDGDIYHDEGEPLPEEEDVPGREIFAEEELDEMRDDGMEEEEIESMINFEAGWRVPGLLIKKYLGEHLNTMDTDKVILTKYSVQV